jgi:very-short-patch-repair endonuclease
MYQRHQNIPALVAVITRKKDWQILLRERWYRIPVKSAPKNINKIKFLAFYQTRIFGDEKYSVNYYAEIKDIETAKRIELLPDEPKHIRANNDYYKLSISNLIKLPRPIPSLRWRRITFIPTTLNKLFNAQEINDLWCTSFIEDKIHKSLKQENINSERQYFVYDTEEPYCLDFAVFCKDGKINVECDGEKYHSSKQEIAKDRTRNNDLTSSGWSILRFSGKEINSDTKSCIRQIKQTIRLLKGIE